MRAKVIAFDEENKMRVANVDHRARHLADARQYNRALHHTRDPHLAFDQIERIVRLNHMTGAQAAVSSESDLLASFTARQPRGDAAGSIAGELCLASIRIEEP